MRLRCRLTPDRPMVAGICSKHAFDAWDSKHASMHGVRSIVQAGPDVPLLPMQAVGLNSSFFSPISETALYPIESGTRQIDSGARVT